MHFYFNGEIYEQVDVVAMGSPFVPVFANLFMGHHEEHFKLPYVGFFSSHTHNRIKGIIKKLCKDQVSVNLVFVPYKIGSMFSKKDKIPSFLKSMVVYINLFVQAVMLVTWVKLPVIYLPG